MSLIKLLTESVAVPIEIEKTGKVNQYNFTVDNIKYQCVIYENKWQRNSYDVAFKTTHGTIKDRVGKNLTFMNTILATVAECMKMFIETTPKVKKLSFDAEGTRRRAYIRFFENHPFFSKFEFKGKDNRAGFIDIIINKGIEV